MSDLAGQRVHITVEVPVSGRGAIYAALKGREAVVLQPEEVPRVRAVLQDALAVSLWDRGGWT